MCVVSTPSGNLVNILNPDPETIILNDIVLSLSNTNRWRGMTPAPYSVLNHCLSGCVYFCQIKCYSEALTFLFHDAAEAYIGGIPTTIKNQFSEIKKVEEKLLDVIFNKFNIPVMTGVCKYVDNQLMHLEAETFDLKLNSSVTLEDDIHVLYWDKPIKHFHMFHNMLKELTNVQTA